MRVHDDRWQKNAHQRLNKALEDKGFKAVLEGVEILKLYDTSWPHDTAKQSLPTSTRLGYDTAGLRGLKANSVQAWRMKFER